MLSSDLFIMYLAFRINNCMIEFLDLTENPVSVLPNHGFHGLYGLKTLILNRMPDLETIEALGKN